MKRSGSLGASAARALAGVLLSLGLASCSGDLTLPAASADGLALQVVNGDGQEGVVGEELGDVVVVQLQTDADVPVPMPNRRVAFVSSGVGSPKFDPDTALTNSQGQAFTRWTLGTASGDYTAEAKVVAEGDTVVVQALIRAKALAGPPDTIRAVGPTTQPGRRGQTLADSLSIMLVDRFGNAVGGHQVAWNVEGDKDGELSQSTATTGADGVSSVTWTLGSRNFLQQAAARVDVVTGSPIGFAAVVLP